MEKIIIELRTREERKDFRRRKKAFEAERTLKVGKDIPLGLFLKSRLVTPKEILAGMKDPVYPNASIDEILFNARYNAFKALEGYDFI